MQKRGQVYLTAALLLGFVLFGLISQPNIIKKIVIEDDFKQLAKNYDLESKQNLNKDVLATKSEKEIEQNFREFTESFTEYAQSQNPNFGLIYILYYKQNLYLGNYLDTSVYIGEEEQMIRGYYEDATEQASAGLGPLQINLQAETNIGETSLNEDKTHFTTTFNQETLNLKIGEYTYPIALSKETPELIIVGTKEEKGQRQVYTSGRIIKPLENE